MAFSRFTQDMNIISKLDNEPNDVGGLSASALKARFDAAGIALKDALNKLVSELGAAAAAGNIGFSPTAGVNKTNVQDAIENVQAQLAGVSQGAVADGSITAGKLAAGAVTEEKLAPDAIAFADVSADVGLVYGGSPMGGTVQKAEVQSKEYLYSAALGLVMFRVVLNVKTAGKAFFMMTHTGGKYVPRSAVSAQVSNDDMGCVACHARYGKTAVAVSGDTGEPIYSYDIELTVCGETDGNYTISGWYFTDGA